MDLPPPPPAAIREVSFSTTLTTQEKVLLKQYAENLREVFDDGFQWDDLFEIVRRSFWHMDRHPEFSARKKRCGVLFMIECLIDITDTPYLPDNITDPIFKALLPPYIDLVHWAMNYSGPDTFEEADDTATEAFMKGLSQYASDHINWEKVFEGTREAIRFFSKQLGISNQEKKDAVYSALCFILDVTTWPFFLDPILDPLTKMLMLPVINITIDAIFPE